MHMQEWAVTCNNELMNRPRSKLGSIWSLHGSFHNRKEVLVLIVSGNGFYCPSNLGAYTLPKARLHCSKLPEKDQAKGRRRGSGPGTQGVGTLKQHPLAGGLAFVEAWEATDVMQILPSTSMLRCGAVKEEEPCPGCSSCLPSQGRRPAGVEGCRWSWGFAAPNGKVPGSREPGQSCRTWVDSAIVIKACELTCGQLYRELSMLQLNELVEDSGKTKIKTGQVKRLKNSHLPRSRRLPKKSVILFDCECSCGANSLVPVEKLALSTFIVI
ncbi:uncharacterized protein LOC128914939 [Rissa tridactyla]|uniref:uncharacterized protein LOC128914939 n=1 Tax=Rissa tridactyla TaxID=75485 RepID=UPI0023BAADE6|nr:uncharacterized protein LOC128914939 [Rissa tridactyla]